MQHCFANELVFRLTKLIYTIYINIRIFLFCLLTDVKLSVIEKQKKHKENLNSVESNFWKQFLSPLLYYLYRMPTISFRTQIRRLKRVQTETRGRRDGHLRFSVMVF